uniref:Uncharacterized protein n=1 Tax=Arundo donax TaxID=35708 RepID=A0A0A9EH18_ARUDO
MQLGLCPISAEESHSHHLIRLSLLCQHLHDLFIPMTKKFSLMHAGLFRTYLMALMTRSKL